MLRKTIKEEKAVQRNRSGGWTWDVSIQAVIPAAADADAGNAMKCPAK
jgi:hypothetical protein